jgi:sensor histidine kinase YesM
MGKDRHINILNVTQVLVWTIVILMPAALSWYIAGNSANAYKVFLQTLRTMAPVLFLYLVNYLWLVPKYLFVEGRKKWFYLINAGLIVLLNIRLLFPEPLSEEEQAQVFESLPFTVNDLWALYAGVTFVAIVVQCVFILLAVGVRQIKRNYDLKVKIEEEKRKSAEAELTWLKSQLNPHFLFNTLNNISSLTQIDPDKAQESIGQLSDLLRYALYDSDKDLVPLAGEIDFMNNYIGLMSLRCNEMTTVEKDFSIQAGDAKVAPLLFISLVENAFKHGVNARYPSFIRVRMDSDGNDLLFSCENSVFEKTGTDHIGSGIGLENLQRRLELLYPGAFDYSAGSDGQTYSVKVRLKNILQ